jgi:hypothetical protein
VASAHSQTPIVAQLARFVAPNGRAARANPSVAPVDPSRSHCYRRDGANRFFDERRLAVSAGLLVSGALTDGRAGSLLRDAMGPGASVGGWLARAAAALFVWAAYLAVRDRRRLQWPHVRWTFKETHLLPVVLQLILFAYWALYWRAVRRHLLVEIPAQLAFAYAFDALLAWTARRTWDVSLGVVPVVLSANLFVWFPEREFELYFVITAIGLAAKAFVRRGERHVFNPSALGAAFVGVLCTAMPRFAYMDISAQLNAPPNMAELIFLVTLVPFVRVQTAQVTLGAWAAMYLARPVGALFWHHGLPSPLWPGWFLAITLFAGDPATVPRGGAARLLFGFFVGAGIVAFAVTLLRVSGTDYWAKVLAVPFANALVPVFERAGERLATRSHDRFPRWHARVASNAFALSTWVAIAFVGLALGRKIGEFDGHERMDVGAPFVIREPRGAPRCDHNPVYCGAFTFAGELRMWIERHQ